MGDITKHQNTLQIKWYLPWSAVSKNRTINFIVGARSQGKTYGFSVLLILRAIKNPKKNKFIYLRRRITDVEAIEDFFDALYEEKKFADYIFRTLRGRVLQYALKTEVDEKPEWVTIGMIMALTEAHKYKSVSFSMYDRLMYDEWLADGSTTFLKQEPKKFLDLLFTIFRLRDYQCFCLANSTSLYNPYFDAFKLYPNLAKEFTYNKRGNFMIQLIPNDEFKESVNRSTHGQVMMEFEEYYDYAVGNNFVDDDDSLVEDRANKSTLMAVLLLDNKKRIGIWEDEESKFWFSEKYNEKCRNKYAADSDNISKDYAPIQGLYVTTMFNRLRVARDNNLIRFESKKAKGVSVHFVKALGLFN